MKNMAMNIDNKRNQKIIEKIMNTSLFSIEEKLKIINKIRINDLSDKEVRDILGLIERFDEGLTEAREEYYRGMDRIYAKYLDENIPLLEQGVEKMELEVKEIKINEKEGDPDVLLDQIN